MSRLLRHAFAAVFIIPSALAQPPSDGELALKVDAVVAQALAEPGAAGLSVAVARGGKVIFAKGYGPADVELSVPVSTDSIFRIGSLTKQFTAAAVMRLVESGKITLDATVQTYVPDFPEKEWPVTVRHLLTHTSGIWSYTEDEKFMGRDSSLELTPADLIATFADRPLEFEPGTKFHYSNSAYYLLGAVVEKASGKPYASYMQDEFFGPLGLSRTRYESNAEIIKGRAQGYTIKDGKLANDKAIGADVPGAAGSLLSTASDLIRWELELSGGKAVKPESYAQMTTSAVLADGTETRYGFGLAIKSWEGRRRISHGGGIFGFSSFLLSLPDDGLTVAVLSNSDAVNSGRVAETVARRALGLAVFEPKDLTLSPADIARFSGEFAFEGISLDIRFFERDGKMWAQATGQPENRLLYQGDGEFRASFDTAVKFVFAADSDSFVLHQGGGTVSARRKK